jgi:hypothetical protein
MYLSCIFQKISALGGEKSDGGWEEKPSERTKRFLACLNKFFFFSFQNPFYKLISKTVLEEKKEKKTCLLLLILVTVLKLKKIEKLVW